MTKASDRHNAAEAFVAAEDLAQDRFLARLRVRLDHQGDAMARHAALAEGLRAARRHTIPQRALGTHAALRASFVERVLASGATVASLPAFADLPAALSTYLLANNLPAKLAIAPDETLWTLNWGNIPALECYGLPLEPEGATALTTSFAAIAETGTLMLCSGPRAPTLFNFLSETHIVVVRAGTIVGPLEDAFAMLRRACAGRSDLTEGIAPAALPRSINLITGPSRTADIEQTMYMGAHGPRRLHVLLVDEA
jgi:L-lactate dehydrogenase complex protein LldG